MTQLINADNGEVLLDQLEIANTFWKRFKGLQFRRSMPLGSGLLLWPCSSLHTCFMRFPIDVVMLDVDHMVIGIHSQVEPWRAVICEAGTKVVIEVNPSTLTIVAGTRLQWFGESSST